MTRTNKQNQAIRFCKISQSSVEDSISGGGDGNYDSIGFEGNPDEIGAHIAQSLKEVDMWGGGSDGAYIADRGEELMVSFHVRVNKFPIRSCQNCGDCIPNDIDSPLCHDCEEERKEEIEETTRQEPIDIDDLTVVTKEKHEYRCPDCNTVFHSALPTSDQFMLCDDCKPSTELLDNLDVAMPNEMTMTGQNIADKLPSNAHPFVWQDDRHGIQLGTVMTDNDGNVVQVYSPIYFNKHIVDIKSDCQRGITRGLTDDCQFSWYLLYPNRFLACLNESKPNTAFEVVICETTTTTRRYDISAPTSQDAAKIASDLYLQTIYDIDTPKEQLDFGVDVNEQVDKRTYEVTSVDARQMCLFKQSEIEN